MPSRRKRADQFEKILTKIGQYKYLLVALLLIAVAGAVLIWLATSTDLLRDPEIVSWERYITDRWKFTDRDGAASILQFHDIGRFDYYLEISIYSGTFGQWQVIEADEDTAIVELISDTQEGVEMKMKLVRIDANTMDTRAIEVKAGEDSATEDSEAPVVEGEEYTRFVRSSS